MAIVRRVRKLVNPRTRRKARGKSKRRNPHRRRLSVAQIRAGFGGKRRQSAMKAARKRKRHTKARHHNPGPRVRTRVVTKTKWRTRKVFVNAKASRKRHRRHTGHGRHGNPTGLLVTYGPAMLNPSRKRRKSVAKRRRKSHRNPSRRHRTRTRVITKYRYRTRARRHNPHRRRRGRRNPATGGFGSFRDMGTAVVGGLVGVTVTKTVPAMFQSTLGGSPLMNVVTSAAVAWGAGMLAGKFVGHEFGKYVMFGGLMQAGSVALNAFIPQIGSVIGLQGLVPSNDILLPYNMFAGRGASVAAGSPASRRGMPGSGFAPAFA